MVICQFRGTDLLMTIESLGTDPLIIETASMGANAEGQTC